VPADEIEAITESAKAVQEAVKLGGKALDVTREAGGWLNRIFGKGIEDAVALHWSDRVRARRVEAAIYDWERLTELMRKVNVRLNTKGVSSLRLVPPKVALALIENATVEYDDDLHTLWANLLATSLDAAADEIHKKYVSILSDLTSSDAKLLRELYNGWTKRSKNKFDKRELFYGDFQEGSVPYDEVPIITLNRLGLVAPSIIEFETYEPAFRQGNREYPPERKTVRTAGDLDSVEFTPLGEAFCKAVILE
jgi:Abortive infection alpha